MATIDNWYPENMSKKTNDNKTKILSSNVSRNESQGEIFQFSNMCGHCVCSKTCNGNHDKENIMYFEKKDIPKTFSYFLKNPQNCSEIKQMTPIIQEKINYHFCNSDSYLIINTCVHNHMLNYCGNCAEGRTDTFMINDMEFRFCWSKQNNGKNTLPIGIHWDVIMKVDGNKLIAYEIIPFSKPYPQKNDRSNTYNIDESFPEMCGERPIKTFGRKPPNVEWDSKKISSRPISPRGDVSMSDNSLISKENELNKREIEYLKRDLKSSENEVNYLREDVVSLEKKIFDLKEKVSIPNKDIIKEATENVSMLNTLVTEQFLGTHYVIRD